MVDKKKATKKKETKKEQGSSFDAARYEQLIAQGVDAEDAVKEASK